MYCASCGKQIADDALFCRYCGKPTPLSHAFAKLVAEARTGNQNAVGALYEKTYSKVYYTVKSMIKDEDAVFDIVQDTYMKAFAHLDSFQGDAKFLPWVQQIAANTARDWLKKKRPMLFAELSSDDGQDTPIEEQLPDERSENLPEQVIEQKETKRLISEIIEELPEDQRAAIGMFYYEEMSVKEIAAAMDVSESAVKSRLMYGRKKIENKVRELEKQGTKLYSLSPIPFLLLLFRNQKAYAAEMPDGRILHAILTLKPAGTATAAGAAQGAGMTGAAAGTEAAGAAAGGLGALKIGLIVLAFASFAGLGTLGVTQIVSRSARAQETSTVRDNTEQEKSEAMDASESQDASEASDELGMSENEGESEKSAALDGEESEALEESDPIDEAMEQYRIIISQADSYDYGKNAEANQAWLELGGYRYALIQMQPGDSVPTLLLEREIKDTELSVSNYYARFFQYDSDTKTVCQPTGVISDGGIRGGLSMAGDGYGIFKLSWSSGTGASYVERITLDGDSLNQETYWSGQIFEIPDSITFIDIEWNETGDLSALDNWTAPASGDSATLPTDGDRIVLTGTVGTYDFDGMMELHKKLGPDDFSESYFREWSDRSITYRVIVLDTPQTLCLTNVDGDYSSNEVLMISIDDIGGMDQYVSQHITFSIDPDNTWWLSDVSLPLGQPYTSDIHILD